jgi:hypothetical protein
MPEETTRLAPGQRVRVRPSPERDTWLTGVIKEAYGQLWAVTPDGGGRPLLFRPQELEVLHDVERP